MASECLGKLGAIDPGKLEFVVDLGGSEAPATRSLVLDMFSVEFCARLLQELTRAHSSAQDQVVADLCAFSAQEVLRIYDIKLSSRADSFTWKVWRSLSDA